MKELLAYLVGHIVEDKEAVEITEVEENGIRVFHLKVAPNDMGKVIGKGGKVIKSLRSALKVKALPARIRFQLVLDEVGSAANVENPL